MKSTLKKVSVVFALIGICAFSAFAQSSLSGKVIEAIDGRTLVLETSTGPMTAQLEFIETPEPEQPLHKIAKEHIAKLTVGKTVEFKPLRIFMGRTIGLMIVDGTDLGLQLIRDGAAWHEPPNISGQPAAEALIYAEHERQAKVEKRGVWSVANLQAPWLVRDEKERKLRQIEVVHHIAKPTLVGVSEFQSDIRHPDAKRTGSIGITKRNELNTWVTVFAGAGKETYGLQTYVDPQSRFSAVYTSPVLIDFPTTGEKERLECRPMMVSVKLYNGAHSNVFLIGFRAISEDYRFSKAKSRLTIMVDGRPLALGTPLGYRGKASIGVQEVMFYKVSWPTMQKIGNAKRVEVRIDKLSADLSTESRDLFKQLATATQ